MAQQHEYTLAGRWDWGGDLRIDYVGVDWSEEKIRRETDALGNSGWCATFEAGAVTEAFRMAGEQYCDETQVQCPARVFDVRVSGKPKVMYTGRSLKEQREQMAA